MRETAGRIAEMPTSATVHIADTAAQLRRNGVHVIDFSAGRAYEPTPSYITEAASQALLQGDTHQTMAKGTPEYRQACASKLQRENHLEADPESEIIATMGVKQGLTLSLMAIVNPGDEVIIEDPCFVSYQPLIMLCGGVPVAVPLRPENHFRWTREELGKAVSPRTRVILFNSPQNPTGTVHTEKDLLMIAEAAQKHDLFVITDEVYERVTWGGRKHICFASLPGMRERTLTVMGLTKTFAMGGWRIGFVFGPPYIIAAMVKPQQHLITCPGSFVQAGAAKAFGEPPRPEVVELWRDWEKRCSFASSELASIPKVTCHMPEGSFYAWPNVSGIGRSSQELAEKLLLEEHVAVVPGSAFGSSGEGYLRVTCVKSWEDLRDGLQRIRRGLSSL